MGRFWAHLQDFLQLSHFWPALVEGPFLYGPSGLFRALLLTAILAVTLQQ